jgi:hypothetical protein
MYSEHIKDVLRIARTRDDVDCILLNLEDFYDLLDGNTFQRIDAVTMKGTQKLGLYGHADGFSIYCSKKCPAGQFALAQDKGLDMVAHIQDLRWTEYTSYFTKYQFPKIGQRYSLISNPQQVVEIIKIRYDDTRYVCLFDAMIVQASESFDTDGFKYKINDPLVLAELGKYYQYLPGQDKPIV